MEVIRYKKNGLKIVDIWFPDKSWKEIKADIIRIHCMEEKENAIDKKYISHQNSLFTNLTQSEEELMNGILNKTLRYDIRRSYKDNFDIQYYNGNQLLENKNLLYEFKQCYDQMFQEKGKNVCMNLNAIRNYAIQNALILSVVYLDKKPIVFHSYVDGKNRVRFFHSCSTFRSDAEHATIIGRANKRLHWEDWLYFKSKGYEKYDWGGIFSFTSEDGIDQFKKAFGGMNVTYDNAILPGTFKGNIAINIQKILQDIKTSAIKSKMKAD